MYVLVVVGAPLLPFSFPLSHSLLLYTRPRLSRKISLRDTNVVVLRLIVVHRDLVHISELFLFITALLYFLNHKVVVDTFITAFDVVFLVIKNMVRQAVSLPHLTLLERSVTSISSVHCHCCVHQR